MVVYSIKDLENLSGIKAHTLRIWEKRYDLVKPKRTETNIRYYTEEDLRGLLNICFLYKKGYKISKIADMCPMTIKDKVSSYSHLDLEFSDQLDTLMLIILELDEYNFNKILDQHLSQKGLETTMNDLIYPLLDKLNLAWISGSFMNVHETFVTQIIKSKIIVGIENLKAEQNTSKKVMIYLPPGEKQELSLLYIHYILKKSGCSVINLGSEVIINDVIAARESCQAKFTLTILNDDVNSLPAKTYLTELASGLGESKLLLTGYKAVMLENDLPEGIQVFSELEAIKSIID